MNPDLRTRVNLLLAKLSTLSDAPTQTINDASPAVRPTAHMRPGETFADHSPSRKPHKDSKAPPGVRERRGTPSPDFDDLYSWFVHRLAGAKSEPEIQKLCVIAEHKWEIATGRLKAPLALAANPETTKQRDKRIAEDPDYLGVAPEIVSPAETHVSGYVSAENIRRVRLAAGRDPESGHPLAEEAFLKGPARKKRARELRSGGTPIAEIARVFRVSRPTVYNWLGEEPESNGDEEAA